MKQPKTMEQTIDSLLDAFAGQMKMTPEEQAKFDERVKFYAQFDRKDTNQPVMK